MANPDPTCRLMNVRQVSEYLGISTTYAYKLMDVLNEELTRAGYLTIRGRVDSRYLQRRFFPSDEAMSLLGEAGGSKNAAV